MSANPSALTGIHWWRRGGIRSLAILLSNQLFNCKCSVGRSMRFRCVQQKGFRLMSHSEMHPQFYKALDITWLDTNIVVYDILQMGYLLKKVYLFWIFHIFDIFLIACLYWAYIDGKFVVDRPCFMSYIVFWK